MKHMNMQPALALPDRWEVRGIEMIDRGVLTITAVSTQRCPCCPLCGAAASRVHSRYTRQVADLPCGGQQVRIQLGGFCISPETVRTISGDMQKPPLCMCFEW